MRAGGAAGAAGAAGGGCIWRYWFMAQATFEVELLERRCHGVVGCATRSLGDSAAAYRPFSIGGVQEDLQQTPTPSPPPPPVLTPLNLHRVPRVALADRVEIPRVRVDVRDQRPRVPGQIDAAAVHADVRRRHRRVVPARDVVLRADVHEAQRHRRQPRDRVVEVRDAVVAAGLVGDVAADPGAADARGAVGVLPAVLAVPDWVAVGSRAQQASYQSNVEVPHVPQLRGREVRDGAAQAVSGYCDRVGWVGGRGALHGGQDARSRFLPRAVETRSCRAAGADVAGVGDGEVEVREPVADGFAAAEGDDDDVVRRVCCDVARDIRGVGTVGDRLVFAFAANERSTS